MRRLGAGILPEEFPTRLACVHPGDQRARESETRYAGFEPTCDAESIRAVEVAELAGLEAGAAFESRDGPEVHVLAPRDLLALGFVGGRICAWCVVVDSFSPA